MPDYSDTVIEFLHSGQLKLAHVTQQASEKLQVRDTNGKQHRVAVKQVIVAHPERVDSSAFPAHVAKLEEAIDASRREVDTELLWDSVREAVREYDLAELATSYFGAATGPQRSGLYRAVFDDPVRFKVRGAAVMPRTPDQVAEQETALRRRRERQEYRASASQWMLDTLASDSAVDLPEELADFPERLERFVRGAADDVQAWIVECAPDRPPREFAFEVLKRSGRFPVDADFRLITAGVRLVFPPAALEEAASLEPFRGDPARRDFSALACFSIDDDDTQEVDDALTVEPTPDGARVGIHIADVASFLQRDCAQDREAYLRGATIYLPYTSVRMLPDRVSCDLASLVVGELRPCLSIVAEIRSDGELVHWELCRGQVRVSRRLSYETADSILESRDDPLAGALTSLERIAKGLEAARRLRGALTVRRPEMKVEARGEEVTIKLLRRDSASRGIVSELMILYNRLVADLAHARAIPIIFRAQDAPDGDIEQPEEYDPIALDQIFRRMSRSKTSLEAQPHAGLGLEAYTQLTSPLRRFQDLVLQRQLAAYAEGVSPPYSQQELFAVLGAAQSAEADNRELEQDAIREYTLRWVESNLCGSAHEAIVVGPLPGGYLVELAELPIRGKLNAPSGIELGERREVTVQHVDPPAGSLILGLA